MDVMARRAVFACEAEPPGGPRFLLPSDDLAAAPAGELTMHHRMDSGAQIADVAMWARSADRAIVGFADTYEDLATLVDERPGTISPAFFWGIGPMPTSEEARESA
jgi:hypothetical protein